MSNTHELIASGNGQGNPVISKIWRSRLLLCGFILILVVSSRGGAPWQIALNAACLAIMALTIGITISLQKKIAAAEVLVYTDGVRGQCVNSNSMWFGYVQYGLDLRFDEIDLVYIPEKEDALVIRATDGQVYRCYVSNIAALANAIGEKITEDVEPAPQALEATDLSTPDEELD